MEDMEDMEDMELIDGRNFSLIDGRYGRRPGYSQEKTIEQQSNSCIARLPPVEKMHGRLMKLLMDVVEKNNPQVFFFLFFSI